MGCDAADSVDTAVRAVSMAVTRPVQKLSGFAAAVSCDAGGVGERSDSWRLPRLEIHRDNAEHFASLLAALAAPLS